MEPTNSSNSTKDPVARAIDDSKKKQIGEQYPDKHRFEEAVQRLREEFDRHPNPPKAIFY